MENNEDYKIHAKKNPDFSLSLGINICGYPFTGIAEKDGDSISVAAYADLSINFRDLLQTAADIFGLAMDIPEIFDVTIERLGAVYEKNVLLFEADLDIFLKRCKFSYQNNSGDYLLAFTLKDFSLNEIPFVSEFTNSSAFGLTDVSIIFSTAEDQYGGAVVAAGLNFFGRICDFPVVQLLKPYIKSGFNGTIQNFDTYEHKSADAGTDDGDGTFWVDINKQISCLTLHRAGISYNNGNIGVMLDISAIMKPFTISMIGAGVEVNVEKKNVRFLISGFGLEFDNGFFTIGGAFTKSGESYAGTLTIGFKALKITLAGTYKRNHFLAYALLNANLGGSPVFFVTGLAAAFGYNKSMILPDINDIPKFPLVAAAIGNPKIPLAELIQTLENGCIVDCEGEKFISAGIKFTSFQIVESFVLLNVSFGHKTTLSLLGLANISMPPKAEKNPIVFAQLALDSVLDPAEGVFFIQGQLTPESYILDKNCKLTGGFALFTWFGSNSHCGDFVISLGGYHPDYKKPEHYPDVPRIGVNWQITSHLSISGDMYFALTPSCMMAGVRMSAVYQDGNLKAWFIAQADFLLQWKPFHYSAHVLLSLGASYTVNFWFVHHTFTIELGADMYFWGPEFAGKVRINWFIISFTIYFGDADEEPKPLTYREFAESFLPLKDDQAENQNLNSDSARINPLTIAIQGKITGEKNGVKYVSSDGLLFIISSVVPISDGEVIIRPMGDAAYISDITWDTGVKNCTKEDHVQSVPTALWGGDGELRQVKSGYRISLPNPSVHTFPENCFISLDKLYELNTQTYKGYQFQPEQKNEYSNSDTISIFSETANNVSEARKLFLQQMGIQSPPDISMSDFAEYAELLFDEDILVPKKTGIVCK